MVVFTWKIYSLKAVLNDQETGLENVIKSINWFYTGEEGEHSHTLSGELNLNPPTNEEFVPWDILKSDKNIVISWLEAGLNVGALQDNIQRVIELKAQPQEVTLYLEETESVSA